MVERSKILVRIKSSLGVLCLGASLALMSPGITVVRADDQPSEPRPTEAVAAGADGEIDSAPRAVDPRREAAPGVVVLNTRGYNYGPDRPTARPVLPPVPATPESPAE